MQIQLKQFWNGRPLVLRENEQLVEIIRALQQTQSYGEVLVVADKMSDGVEKYLLATNALFHLKDWIKLVQFCDKGLSFSEESEFYHLKGKAMGKLGNNAMRIDLIRKAIHVKPSIAAYRRNLAAAYYQEKRYEQAAQQQQKAIQLQPGNHINHHNLATTLFRMGNYHQAERTFATAITLKPKQSLSHSWHGDSLRMLARYSQAFVAYNNAFQLSGNPIYLRQRDKIQDLLRHQGYR